MKNEEPTTKKESNREILSRDSLLRDYFAAKAMQGILSRGEPIGDYLILSTLAYRTADAMLKAREQ